MFWKKKKKPVDTPLDKAIRDKAVEILRAAERIKYATTNLIVAKGVAELYPEGPDKEKAIKDMGIFQISLLGAIGTYDRLVIEYQELLRKEEERITTLNFLVRRVPSHNIVEEAYKEFYHAK